MIRTRAALEKLLEKNVAAARDRIPAGAIVNQLPATTLPPGGPAGLGYPPDPHDHTSSTDGGKLTAAVFDGYTVWEEIAAPSAPAANTARLYAKDVAGVTGLYFKDSAGTEFDLSAGSGTVTSVALTVPSDLSVSGSPITTSGTLAITRNAQSANTALMGPTSGGAATPAYRALVAADTPAAAILASANVFTAAQSITVEDAGTTNALTLATLGHNSSGTPAAGFGAALDFQLESSTTTNQDAARISSLWTDATHASRTSALTFATVLNGTLAEHVRITGAGNIGIGTTAPVTSSKVTVDGGIRNRQAGSTRYRSDWSVAGGASNINAYDDTGAVYIPLDVDGNPITLNGSNGASVGIGVTPTATLDVARGTATNGAAMIRGTTHYCHFSFSTAEDTYIRGGKSTSHVIINDTGSKVGIGTATPATKLQIRGAVGSSGYFDADAVAGTEVEILPAGAVVYHFAIGPSLCRSSSGALGLGSLGGSVAVPGAGSTTTTFFNDGASILSVRVYSTGQVTILRTSGSNTFKTAFVYIAL